MTRVEEQNELFTLIGEKLKDRVECYIIGGSAMLYYGIKEVTKDIDLVFTEEKDRQKFHNILTSLGYKERGTAILYYKKKNTPLLLEREDTRFDLFFEKIITTNLTRSMKDRVKSVYEYSNLIVKVLSPEDLIITKCATERPGDRADVAEILKKTNIDWDIVIEESIKQADTTPYIFPIFLFDFLYELKEDLKADIPKEVINKIRKIGEEMLTKKLKKPKIIKK